MQKNQSQIGACSREICKKFFPLLVVGFTLHAIVLLVLFGINRNGNLQVLQSDQRHEINEVTEIIRSELRNIIGDLLVLNEPKELSSYIRNRDPSLYEDLVHAHSTFLLTKQIYNMVRIFDTTGVELVRVEYHDGVITVIDRDSLQDKSSRYYVRDGLRLRDDEILVSDLDLNIENGQVEFPIRPTLRFVKTVTDDHRRRVGLLTFNYDASLLIELLSHNSSLKQGHPLVVNRDGYWLLAENPEDEWGFALPDRQSRRFSNSFPVEWDRISHAERTQILTDNGLYTARALNFSDSLIQYRGLAHLIHSEGEEDSCAVVTPASSEQEDESLQTSRQPHKSTLSLISHIPKDEVDRVIDHLSAGTILTVSVLTLLLGVALWYLARAQTIRLRAEALLSASEVKHRAMFDASLSPMINIDAQGVILAASATVKKVFGWNPAELVGQNIKVLMPEPFHSNHDKHLKRYAQSRVKRVLCRAREFEGKRKDGSVFPCEITVSDLNVPGESRIQFVGVVRDISERKATEMKLRERDELDRCLFMDAPYACFSANETGVITRLNNQFAVLSGLTEKDIVGKKFSDFLEGNQRQLRLFDSLTLRPNRTGEVKLSKEIEIEFPRANGKTALISMTSSAIFDEDSRLVAQIYSCIDVTSRREAELALRLKDTALLEERKRKQEYLNGIIDNAPNLIYARDRKGRFTLINSSFEKFVGVNRDELLGRSLEELPYAEQSPFALTRHDMELYRNRASVPESEEKLFDAGGNERWLLTSKKLLELTDTEHSQVLNVSTDVTELSAAKTSAIAADKMASIGTLASGVAHEFKNYLAAVIGNAEYLGELLTDAQADAEMHEVVGDIIKAGDRANEVAMALLSYSKRRQESVGVEDLDELVKSTLLLVTKRALQHNIEIATKFEDASRVRVSAGKIQQLILNLLSNAMDAIPDEGGAIVVTVRNENEFVTLRISDSGPGIAQDQLDRVFDPFFSTKGVWGSEQRSGTGLGLAICRNIAEKHDGVLTVESVVGMGTTFVLKIPCVREGAPPESGESPGAGFDTFVLLSHESDMIERLSQQVTELGARCAMPVSPDRLSDDSDLRRTLLICDGAYPSSAELYEVCAAYRARGARAVLVNKAATGAFLDESCFDFVCNGCSSLKEMLQLARSTPNSEAMKSGLP